MASSTVLKMQIAMADSIREKQTHEKQIQMEMTYRTSKPTSIARQEWRNIAWTSTYLPIFCHSHHYGFMVQCFDVLETVAPAGWHGISCLADLHCGLHHSGTGRYGRLALAATHKHGST